MKSPPFDYRRVSTVEEAASVLGEYGDDAKVLAGGQSLMPMLNFRLLRPSLLLDINALEDLDGVEKDETGLRIGALCRHRSLQRSTDIRTHLPILAHVVPFIAHVAIRNRGTIGGSLSHADPSAELALVALLLDAQIELRSATETRYVPAHAFFVDALETALQPTELLTSVHIATDFQRPQTALRNWGFMEVARRRGDYAVAAVGVLLSLEGSTIRDARIAVSGVARTPIRLKRVEDALRGEAGSEQVFDAIVPTACDGLSPDDDLHASGAYRMHLVRTLLGRTLRQAVAHAA
ncbi:MAG: xanthine dehydrogenase family protein subunit M [Pseudomonadota bacterium]